MFSAADNILFSTYGSINQNETYHLNDKKRRRADFIMENQQDEAETGNDDTIGKLRNTEEDTHSSAMDEDSVLDTFFLHPSFNERTNGEIIEKQEITKIDENTFLDELLSLTESDSSSSSVVDYSFIPEDLRTPFRTSRGKIPRLLKNDLRRFYPVMFVIVLNSHDRNLIYPYLERFYVPQAGLELLRDLSSVWRVNSTNNQIDSYKRPRGALVTGRDSLLTYFLLVFREFPDICLSVKNMQVKRFNYSRKCLVSFRLSLSWTHAVLKQSATPRTTNEHGVTDTTFSSYHSAPVTGAARGNEATLDMPRAEEMNEDQQENHCTGGNHIHANNHKEERVWETYAYEVEADDVLELNEDWYITQINSTTVSTTVRKTGEFTI